jgi:hypothetical protein
MNTQQEDAAEPLSSTAWLDPVIVEGSAGRYKILVNGINVEATIKRRGRWWYAECDVANISGRAPTLTEAARDVAKALADIYAPQLGL